MRMDSFVALSLVIVGTAMTACGPPTVEVRSGFRIEFTGPGDARWTRLNSNLTEDLEWEIGATVDGRLASRIGYLDARRLDLAPCPVGTVGGDCGYVVDPEFDAAPGHGVTMSGNQLVITGTIVMLEPTNAEAVAVPNGIDGGHFHIRRRK